MSEKDGKRVSLDKTAGDDAVDAAVQRPKQALWVIAALGASGLMSLLGSVALYGLHGFLVSALTKANNKIKGKNHQSPHELLHTVSQVAPNSVLRSALFFLVTLVVIRAVWKGRYWARWAVIGLWIIAFFTQVYGSLVDLLYIAQDAPLALKVPVFLSALAFVIAVGLVGFSKPLIAWLNLSRPERTVGAAPGRRGLFAPRDSVRAARLGVPSTSPVGSRKVREMAARNEDLFRGDANTERARAKQRMNAESVQRGADAARARAKASKSRRPGQ